MRAFSTALIVSEVAVQRFEIELSDIHAFIIPNYREGRTKRTGNILTI